jgi:hypothetical protein
MFGTFRKHQSWLWFIIIGVMVLSMVLWQSQTGKNGNGQRGPGNFGSIDGKAISAAEFQGAQSEVSLMYYLRNREWPDSPEATTKIDLQRETYQRLFLIRKLEEFNIHPDPGAAAHVAGMVLRQVGNGQPVSLDVFVDQLLKPHGINAEDFQHFLEHDLGIQQLIAVVGLSGKLVPPSEVQALYVQENQEISAEAVFFSVSNYLSKIPDPTPQALSQFYTNEQANYREPDQMQVSYVFFNVTNFMPEAEKQLGTNVYRAAEEALTRLGTNGLRYGKTPEEARAKIRELLIQDTAISNAYAKAVAFQNEVVTKQPLSTENLSTVAKEKGLETKVTKPFEKSYGPSELNFGPNFSVAELFNLTADEPFPDQPIPGPDGVYVLAFNKKIPSRIPPLAEIHSRVESDYKYLQALRLAQMNGHVFSQTAATDLAHGKTFKEACTTANVTPVQLPSFSESTEMVPEVEDRADLGTFKQVAFTNAVGSVSGFAPTREGGFVVYVSKRLLIDEAKMTKELPEFSKMVRDRRENEAFEMWFNREASTALRDTPVFKNRQQRTEAAQ